MKIVVLAGGLCSERNVSIVSGKQVYNALRKKGHNVVLLDVFIAVYILGLFVNVINKEFKDLEVSNLSDLKDYEYND